MDPFKRAFHEMAFKAQYLESWGDEFQDLFSTIMEKRYPGGDFTRVRPWGNVGDKKNDGYLKSERTLFACYAPNEMDSKEAINKINSDFAGAQPHWKQYFDKWIFVHNSKIGLGPDVLKLLLDLQKKKPPDVTHWGFEDLRKLVFELTEVDIASLLGAPPSPLDVANVSFQSLDRVLKVIGRQAATQTDQIRPVPANKILENGLSESVQELLRAGTAKSRLVAEYFRKSSDPNLGDEVVQAFHNKYLELDQTLSDPDEIFSELQKFAGGVFRGTPEHESAVLAVLAYLFESCDIYKDTTARTTT
jgi:hypothetical protein